ncbi:MAG: T9SS type A sorting domain-containing protein [Ignavibacteria bacterium]|nr:T9SS type A sorting domain-containing protein [Ignavibacteria bacterium]
MNTKIKTFSFRTFLPFCFLMITSVLLSSGNVLSQSCSVTGPANVPLNTHILYLTDISGQNWEVYSYNGAQAQIVFSNDDSLMVNSGPTPGNFTVYVLSNPQYNNLCSVNVTVDLTLPVELSSFTSNIDQRNVTLNWTTVSEENNSGFQIERSLINEDWRSAGFVNGAGTLNSPVNYSFTDNNVPSGIYRYRLKQIDFNGNYEYHDLRNEVIIGKPDKFTLHQNYPNPFNPVTKINYDLASDDFVKITLYDISGKEVRTLVNEFRQAGFHSAEFNASELTSGIYIYKLESPGFTAMRRMILVK